MKYVLIGIVAFFIFSVVKKYLKTKDNEELDSKNDTLDEKFNANKLNKEKRINQILEKVNKRGLNSLTIEEKKVLDAFSSEN